jgi:hypothetical protein
VGSLEDRGGVDLATGAGRSLSRTSATAVVPVATTTATAMKDQIALRERELRRRWDAAMFRW